MPHRIQPFLYLVCGFLAIAGMGCNGSGSTDAKRAATSSTAPPPATGRPADSTSETNSSPYINLTLLHPIDRTAEEKVRNALKKKVTTDFKEEPLENAIEALAKQGDFKARINASALAEEGITKDEPITLSLPVPIRLRSAMQIMLEPLGLTVVQQGDEILITTEISAEEILTLRHYSIRRLLEGGLSLQSVKDVLADQTSGPWYAVVGTGGRLSVLGNIVNVVQTARVHHEIEQILAALERVIAGPETSGIAVLYSDDDAALGSLRQMVTVSLKAVPLSQLPAKLHNIAHANFVIDRYALEDENIDLETPISIDVEDVPIQTALESVLEPLKLTCIPQNGALLITTQFDAEEKLRTLLYNVRDFKRVSYDSEFLVEMIEDTTSGPWPNAHGWGGGIQILEAGFLVVRQTMKVHSEIARVLANTRDALRNSAHNGELEKAPQNDQLVIKNYDVKYVVSAAFAKASGLRAEHVADAIPKFVAPETWKDNGGEGDLSIVKSMVVIRQTPSVHRRIRRFLRSLHQTVDWQNAFGPAKPSEQPEKALAP